STPSTKDLPTAIDPVSPTFSIGVSTTCASGWLRASRFRRRQRLFDLCSLPFWERVYSNTCASLPHLHSFSQWEKGAPTLPTSPPLRRLQSISHQHSYCHQPDPTRHGRAQPGDQIRLQWVNVANQGITALLDALDSLFCFVTKEISRRFGTRNLVHAHVDYCRARLDEIPTDECGPANCRHQDVRPAGDRSQVARSGVTDSYRG